MVVADKSLIDEFARSIGMLILKGHLTLKPSGLCKCLIEEIVPEPSRLVNNTLQASRAFNGRLSWSAATIVIPQNNSSVEFDGAGKEEALVMSAL